MSASTPQSAPVPFRTALAFWTKLGFVSFGGPTGQIALMHEEVVEKKRWIDEDHFLHALNYCMLLPGPEAQQLATYIGWLMHGARGGIAAGALFVLPSVFILLGLSWMYAAHGDVAWVAAIFFGLQPAVMAIVAQAVLRIGKRALKNAAMYLIAAGAFVAIYFLDVDFPWIVAAAGAVGWIGGRLAPSRFVVIPPHGTGASAPRPIGPPPTLARALRVILVCGGLWWAPVLAAGLVRGFDDVLAREGVFFSKAAMVTFGGAYAVLPYVAEAAVEDHGWLAPHEMLDGLGLAETTPGPLIMVVQFVGFLGAWRNAGALAPWQAGVLGAFLTTWVTFLPCFLWIFLGAPHVERMRGAVRLSAALSAITAAVVGVVLNLAVWFARHTLFPEGGELNVFAAVVATAAFVGLLRWKWNAIAVVLACGALGLAWRLTAA